MGENINLYVILIEKSADPRMRPVFDPNAVAITILANPRCKLFVSDDSDDEDGHPSLDALLFFGLWKSAHRIGKDYTEKGKSYN